MSRLITTLALIGSVLASYGCNSQPVAETDNGSVTNIAPDETNPVETSPREASPPEEPIEEPIDEIIARLEAQGVRFARRSAEGEPIYGMRFDKTQDDDLRGLGQLGQLEDVWLSSSKELTGEGLRYLPASVRSLQLNACDNVRDQAGVHLARFKKLRQLSAQNVPFSDATMAHLAKLPELQSLSLPGSQITDAGLVQLGELPLEVLSLKSTDVTDRGLAVLARFNKLRVLNLGENPITDASCEHIARCPELKSLSITKAAITDDGVAALVPLKKLTDLLLADTQVTEKVLEIAPKFAALRTLRVWRCDVSDEAIEKFSASNPDIRVEN